MHAVQQLRAEASQSQPLSRAVHEIKTIQAKRFKNTYKDLLESPIYQNCALFFLTELYSERDYARRDQQFARVAGAIEMAFPQPVIATTIELAKLHHVTETLDLAMAQQWLRCSATSPATRYCLAWQTVNSTVQRRWQLQTVISIGQKLGNLTRRRSLRLLLKMMRHPAELAGLSELQSFLETGFDRFSDIAKTKETLNGFLDSIEQRESDWISQLDATTEGEADTKLGSLLVDKP